MENKFAEFEEGPFRVSNASTTDFLLDSSCDFDKACSGETKIWPEGIAELFQELNAEQKTKYKELESKLPVLYEKLDQEIEPLCIRDLCSVNSKSVGLGEISNSLISRRRKTLTCSK